MRIAIVVAVLALTACASSNEDDASQPAQIQAAWGVVDGTLRCYPDPAVDAGPVMSVIDSTHQACEWTCATYQGVRDLRVVLEFLWLEDSWGCTDGGLNCGPTGPTWRLWISRAEHIDGC